MRRPTASLPAVLVLAAAVLAGCGSSGGGGSSGAQGGGSKPATAAARSGSAGLVEYLAEVEPKDQQLKQLRQTVLKAVDGVNVRKPDASWAKAAARLKKATAGLDRLAVSIQSLTPPAPLKDAHADLAESVAVIASYVYDVQNALSTGIPSLLARAANENSTRMALLRGNWETAVRSYAKKLGVTLPGWLGGPSLVA